MGQIPSQVEAIDRALYTLFKFHGRINRLTWLGFSLFLLLTEYAAENTLRYFSTVPKELQAVAGDSVLGDPAAILASLIFLWPSLAVDVKRWHDLGKSGWYCLTVYGPVVAIAAMQHTFATGDPARKSPLYGIIFDISGLAVIIYFVLLAARKGIAEANRFGPESS